VFFPHNQSPTKNKSQTQISTKPQTHIFRKVNLSLQTNKFSWQINKKNKKKKKTTGKKKKKKKTKSPNHHHQIKEHEHQTQAKE